MISVISINKKFQTMEPKRLIEKLVNSKHTKGLEITVDPDDDFMMNYMEQLVNLCKENNIRFQVHGNSELDLDKQKEFYDLLSRYSDFLGYPINVVMHSLTRDTTEEEVSATQEYFSELLKVIDINKTVISVENLNDADGLIRLDKTEMIPILYNDERLCMTYDIGHELADYGNITDLNPLFINRITNIHLHARTKFYEDGYDHKPIDVNADTFQDVLKGILYLKHLSYDGPVTYEYDVYLCDGESLEEKVDNYIKSIDEATEHFM